MLDFFFLRDGVPTALLLPGSYRPALVVLSVCIAVLTSCMAMQLAGLARLAKSPALRQTALLTGSFAQGGGIWSMHFIGMLAFQLCTPVNYDFTRTLLSMLPAVFASWVTLTMLSHRQVTGMQLLIGGVLVGSGIGAMHYGGMAAMVLSPMLRYDPLWFVASIVVAVVLAVLALWIRFGLRRRGTFSTLQSILLGGTVMGCAISAMHYIGMAAARFVGEAQPGFVPEMNENTSLALAIALMTVMASVFVLAGNAMLRYRQLYAQMQQSEAQLRAVVDTAVDGIITINQSGVILSVNGAAERMFGWPAEQLAGQNINCLMPDPYRAGHDGYLANYLATGDARVIGVGREVAAQRRDGSVFPIRLAVGRAEADGETRFIGFVTDISDRTRMERELQAQEAQYRTLIANIPGVAFRSRVDPDWTKIFISHAVTALTGWERQLFLDGSLSMVSLIHPDDLARVREHVGSALRELRSYIVEYRILHRDGGERWVSESGGGVYDVDHAPQWIDGVIIDITDSKIRAAEHEGIVHAIRHAMAVVEFDLQGHILDANDNFLQLTGYCLDDLRGRHHRMLCHPEEADSQAYQDFWAALRRGEFQSREFCRLAKDGHEVWIQAAYNPILDADGQPWKVVKLASDLSLRKRMERDLTAARDSAEQAAAAKGMFLANMSHEIRTPMNAIIGFTELLQGTPLNPQQARHLHTVRESAHSLLCLLNDILDTAKLERGAVELDNQDFSLYALCEQLVATFGLQAERKQLQLQLDYAADCPHALHGDALRMRQILTNLLGNAVKFTEHGSVTLQVFCAGGQLYLAVRDTGIGIAADRLDSIFAPFTQADASMARRFGGTGLGTAIARQLAELMQGSIRVESTPGAGSCFTVCLPLQPAEHPLSSAAAVVPVAVSVLPPLRILAVDDVAQNLELLQLILTREGHQVVLAGGGAAAVGQYCQQPAGEPFDVVLMDVQMPDVDGLEATRRMHQWSASRQLPPVPVIALTASVLSQDRADAEAAGMRGFATKPIEPDALLGEIARVLGMAPLASVAAAGGGQAVDKAAALVRWGSEAKLHDMWRRFLQDYRDAGMQLAAASPDACRALAHRLRGVAANLGLQQLAALATQAEQRGGVDDAWQVALAGAMRAIDALLLPVSSSPAPAGVMAPLPQLLPLLARLEQACQHGTLDDDSLAALAAALPAPRLQSLQQALDEFDFDAALQALAQLRSELSGETRQA